MPRRKRTLPKRADERSMIAVDRDLNAATALYALADRKVELARRRFSARLEAAHWYRYRSAVEKMEDPIGYFEWLIKAKTMVGTYSWWSSDLVYEHFSGLHAEAHQTRFLKYGETELGKYWYMDGFNAQVAKRETNLEYGVTAKVIMIQSSHFVELVPTIQYSSNPMWRV